MPYGLRVRVPSSASDTGESSNGRTPDFDSVCPGSNPGSPVQLFRLLLCSSMLGNRLTVGHRTLTPFV